MTRHGHPLHALPLALGLGLALALTACASARKAQVTSPPMAEQANEFALTFTAVNGSNIPPRNTLMLDPGDHLLQVRIPQRFNTSQTGRNLRGQPKQDQFVTFRLSVQEGQTYRLRGEWDPTDFENPFQLVVLPQSQTSAP